jgi:hypothetical protein
MQTTSTKGNGATKRSATPNPAPSAPPRAVVDDATRREMIAREAYAAAERRGFKNGSDQQDWLDAEIHVDQMLNRAPRG